MTSTGSNDAARLDGRIAVVTGGTQGLGEAIADLFAERGASGLVICGRNAVNGHVVAERLSSRGCATRYVPADLGRVEDCRRVVAAADTAFGRVDVLVIDLDQSVQGCYESAPQPAPVARSLKHW